MKAITELAIKIFADGADPKSMLELQKNPLVKGFTTNPSLMYKAGIKHYENFAHEILNVIQEQPISFEVLSDDFCEMEKQALRIASWGKNVYVKIPIVNTAGKSAVSLIKNLAQAGVKQNITAVMTMEQVQTAVSVLADSGPTIISVFAGRIADTGRDPLPLMREAMQIIKQFPQIELLWASTRELLNIFQAAELGCQVITVPHDILQRLNLVGKDLAEYSLETVKMFHEDAIKAGLSLSEVLVISEG